MNASSRPVTIGRLFYSPRPSPSLSPHAGRGARARPSSTQLLASLAWALVPAAIFVRPYRWFESFAGPSAAAGLSVLSVALIIVAPLFFIGQRLLEEAAPGLILGPIAFTMTTLMLEFWRRRADPELQPRNGDAPR